MKSARVVAMICGLGLLAGCVPQRQAPPPLPPQPRQPVQPQLPPPPPTRLDWRDMPLTPGSWVYSNQGGTSQALFGAANSGASFVIRCERAARRVTLSRAGNAATNVMTIRTSESARNVGVTAETDPLPYLNARLAANDRLLDAIAFSRGRFTVEVPGLPMMVLPAWPEPARVVEDCRG
ncbi:MAG TPA: hypothetical protein VGD10_00415 [Allosphingosinicella sp.]|uniref:hypothetical protein n=1 Tax=Allosphingosinicella sp. TaxID=2823234 RepID=UPI002ED79C5E